MLTANNYLPNLANWKSRINLFEILTIESASGEPDDSTVKLITETLFDDVSSSKVKSGEYPWKSFRIKRKDGSVVLLEISAKILQEDPI